MTGLVLKKVPVHRKGTGKVTYEGRWVRHGSGEAPRADLSWIERQAPAGYVWDRPGWTGRGEIRNLPGRPRDAFAGVIAETISPTMGAYGLGQGLGGAIMASRERRYGEAAGEAAMIAAGLIVPGPKGKGQAQPGPGAMRPFYGEAIGAKGRIANPAGEVNRLGLRSGLPDAPADGFFNPASAALLQGGVAPKQTLAYYRKQMGSRGGKLPPGQWDEIAKGKAPGDVVERDWLVKEIDARTPKIEGRQFFTYGTKTPSTRGSTGLDGYTSRHGDPQYQDWSTQGNFKSYTETAVGYPNVVRGFEAKEGMKTPPGTPGKFTDGHFTHPNLEGWHRTQDTSPNGMYRTNSNGYLQPVTRIIEEVQPQRYQKMRDNGVKLSPDEVRALQGEERRIKEAADADTMEATSLIGQIRAAGPTKNKSGYMLPSFDVSGLSDVLSYLRAANESTVLPADLVRASKELTPKIAAHHERMAHIEGKLAAAEKGVAPSPFSHDVNAATGLLNKSLLRDASMDNIDRLAWTPGEVQAERYNKLLRNIRGLQWHPDTGALRINHRGRWVTSHAADHAKLADVVGKDAADQLVRTPRKPYTDNSGGLGAHEVLFPEGVTLGGDGMIGYYGDGQKPGIMGESLRSIVRRVGGQDVPMEKTAVIKRSVPSPYNKDVVYPSIRLAPEVRKRVLKTGLPIYGLGAATLGARTIADTIQEERDRAPVARAR